MQFGERIHWFGVNGGSIRVKKNTVSKISGFLWMGPKCIPLGKWLDNSLEGRLCWLLF